VNVPVLVLQLVNFAFFATLPQTVLRRGGRLNGRWWLTATPFLLWPIVLVFAAVTGMPPWRPAGWTAALESVAVLLNVASIALISSVIGTHRVPISLWHQDDDAPQHLVTYGAYGRIRHPLYTANLLAFAALAAFLPHWSTFALTTYVWTAMTVTAAREERRLAGSAFGSEYREYMVRTGRFFPRFRPA
jgi:protein-S-isoprenylcysteine O-methyltransferase Ste14